MNWTIALALGLGLPLLAVALFVMWSSPVLFLAVHVASRLVMDSAAVYTYKEIASGLSIVKVYSMGVTMLMGLYLWHRRRLGLRPYGVMALILVGAAVVGTVLTSRWAGFVNVALRWTYVWLVAYLTLYAAQKTSPQRVAGFLLVCLVYPLVNLSISAVVLGIPPKESGGSLSYVGTFDHESHIGYMCMGIVALSTGLLATVRAPFTRLALFLMIVAGHIALFTSNYRTALVSEMVYWMVMLIYLFPRLSVPARINLVVFGGVLLVGLAAVVGPELVERMSELFIVAADPGKYFDFTELPLDPDSLLTGRLSLINTYMYYYTHAPIELQIVGLGPEAGTELAGKYAHNEYIGTLVEQGVVGITALLGVLVSAFVIVRRAARNGDWMTRSMAGMLAAIATMSLGTMPFRDARGLLFLGIGLGLVECYRQRHAAVAEQAAARVTHSATASQAQTESADAR